MQQWEYLILGLHHRGERELNEVGKEGWEMVTIYEETAFFKRPCPTPFPPQTGG